MTKYLLYMAPIALIPSIEAQALTYCEENPDRPVVQAFAEAYSEARR